MNEVVVTVGAGVVVVFVVNGPEMTGIVYLINTIIYLLLQQEWAGV